MVSPGLRVSLVMTQSPIYVHPPSILESDSSDSRYEKIVTGHVIVTASEPTRIGPIKLAWELSHHPDVDTRTVLARYECVCRGEDSDILAGDTR
jgi:hypothetical protein